MTILYFCFGFLLNLLSYLDYDGCLHPVLCHRCSESAKLLYCRLNLSWCGGCLHVLDGNQALQVGLLGQCSYSITLLMLPAIYMLLPFK
jgi:hypothetical protein